MRAKTILPFVVFLVACALLGVALATQRNGMPHGIGWPAFGILVVGLLWVFGGNR